MRSSPSSRSSGHSSLISEPPAMRASRLTESLLLWEETDDDRALVEGGAHPEMEEEEDSLQDDESNALALALLKLYAAMMSL